MVRTLVLTIFVAIGLSAFLFTTGSATKNAAPFVELVETDSEANPVKNYRLWTKVNDKPEYMSATVSALCAAATAPQKQVNIHEDKFINVFVNAVGKDQMLTSLHPNFPVGTVIVKEKLAKLGSKAAELLTVMVKRKKGFNPEVGDWEFMTFNGSGTKITSRGKLESCAACHVNYDQNDYINRSYLPDEIKRNLK